MSIVNHTKLSELFFPKRDRKYLLKITVSQIESHLLYIQILNPLHHSCQHVNQSREELHQSVSETHPQRICYPIKCFDDTLYSQQPVTFVKEFGDDDVAQIFMDTLEKNIKEIYNKFKFPKSMIMTMHDKMAYDNSTLCHNCNEELVKDRVRDHCHLSGKFRGAAHEICKLKYKVPKFFQLYFTTCQAMIVT